MSCLLCLSNNLPMIKIFSKRGKNIKICEIISKHFWLKPNSQNPSEQNICKKCWRIVKEFHELYEQTAANTYFEEDVLSEHSIIKSSIDKTDTEILSNHNTENFPTLDEIKVETDDFKSLPQVEVIENTTTLSPKWNTNCDMKTSDVNSFDNTIDSDPNDSHEIHTENFPTLDEIKVEADDFEILPKVEIIESTTTLSPQCDTNSDVKMSDDNFFDNTFDSDSNDSHDSFQDYFKDNVDEKNKTNFFKNAYTIKMCDLCGVILKHMDGLRHHMKTVHDTREYKCEFCNRKSTNSIALYRHIKRNHKMDFGNNCPHCSQSFSSKRGLKLHLKTHKNPDIEKVTNLSIA